MPWSSLGLFIMGTVVEVLYLLGRPVVAAVDLIRGEK